MCDPATAMIASTVAQTALGAITGGMSSKANTSGVNQVAQANLNAQRNFNRDLDEQRDGARNFLNKSMTDAGKGSYDENYANEVARIEAQNQPSFTQDVFLPGQGSGSEAVQTAVVTSQNKAAANNAAKAKLQAALEGFGNAGFERDLALGQNAQKIGMYGDFAKGAYDNLAAEQAYAQTAGDKNFAKADKISGIGELLGAGVNAAGQYVAGKNAAPTSQYTNQGWANLLKRN